MSMRYERREERIFQLESLLYQYISRALFKLFKQFIHVLYMANDKHA